MLKSTFMERYIKKTNFMNFYIVKRDFHGDLGKAEKGEIFSHEGDSEESDEYVFMYLADPYQEYYTDVHKDNFDQLFRKVDPKKDKRAMKDLKKWDLLENNGSFLNSFEDFVNESSRDFKIPQIVNLNKLNKKEHKFVMDIMKKTKKRGLYDIMDIIMDTEKIPDGVNITTLLMKMETAQKSEIRESKI